MLETELKKLTAAVEALNATLTKQDGTPQAAPAATIEVAAPAAPAVEVPAAAAAPAAAAVDLTPPVAAPAGAVDTGANQAAPAGAIGKKEVTDAALALGKKPNGSALLRDVLAKFGAANISGLKPEQYVEVHAALTAG